MYYDEKRKQYRERKSYNGKTYDLSAKTERELIEKIANWKRDYDENKRKVSSSMTVAAWQKQYLDTYKKQSIELSSYKILESIGRTWVAPNIGNMALRDVKRLHVQKIMNKTSGMSGKHIRRIYHHIRGMFDKAVQNNLLAENPATYVDLPKAKDGKGRALTKFERVHFEKVCGIGSNSCHVYTPIFLFMLYTGAGPGETCRAMGQHIHWKENKVFIEGTKTESRPRFVPLTDKLRHLLTNLNPEPFKPIFRHRRNGALNPHIIRDYWGQIRKAMNISAGCKTDYGKMQRLIPPYPIPQDCRPYCLRHSYACDLRDAGVDISIAKDYMGHASLDMLARVYLEQTEKAFNASLDKLNDV